MVEVYSYDEAEEPMFRYAYNCGESVTSVNGGKVGNPGYDEILVTTYTGWLFGLSTEPANKRLDPNFLLVSEESAQKICKLRFVWIDYLRIFCIYYFLHCTVCYTIK
ncbi:Bardet-Biedl syndrome 7 protein-like [Centruroides sculpturatus]|uniref:Bardet-Biedl syndrome 7 protein-like n=1 Tax=Centruroides sculpturatus TaxID=218467 RepID=UPI000C6EA6E9|nr:Bardet-Biedl syndrome 7 protein-like [Centruroides sculpturatus]